MMVETRSSKRRRLISSNVSPRRPDLPATFESLIDDTLTTTLQFVGKKSYRSFGGTNKRCKEVYLSSGMTKETFLFGYAPLSVIIDKIEIGGRFNPELHKRVGKGVVFYNRRDIFELALQERNNHVLRGICSVASQEGRTDLLEEMWNDEYDEDDISYIFEAVESDAVQNGKLNVFKWLKTKEFCIDEGYYACEAAENGHLHIIQWFKEEQGVELDGYLYDSAIDGGHLHVMKWLREQEVPWRECTFKCAAYKGNLDILQWLHDEGCPWPEEEQAHELRPKPEVIDWCRANGYADRVDFESDSDSDSDDY